MNFFRWLTLCIVFALIAPNTCPATTVTGHLNYGGQPLTGYVSIGLVYPGTNGTALDLPGAPGRIPVYNGNFPSMTLDGNDTLQPRGTFYQVTYYNASQSPLARMNYLITGASFDLGTAIPTPITTNNINLLDLTGLRSISAQTLTLINGITLGQVSYSSAGVTGAKQFDDLRFAAGYAGTSSSCGITEALAALPTTGGTIILSAGSCTATTPVTINKPVVIAGLGQGGVSGSTTYNLPTVLVNGMTASPLFTITPSPVTGILAGVTLINFAVKGNLTLGGSSSGSNILINGGSSGGSVNDVHLTNLLLYGAHDSGVTIVDSTNSVALDHVVSIRNGGSGLNVIASGGITKSVTATGSTFSSNTGNGVTVSGTGVRSVAISDSVLVSNTGAGVNVVSGATSASVVTTRTTIDDNTGGGVQLADGFGHTVADSIITGGSHQSIGIHTSQPTITSSTVQVTLRGNTFLPANLTTDVVQDAAVSNMLMYPQTTAFTSTYAAPGTVHFIAFTTTNVDYYFSFTGCPLTVGGNSFNCTGSRLFSAMSPVVPTQPDTNYFLVCNTVTTQGWGSSTGINIQTTTGFSFAENVDRYNAIPATVTPTVWCHLHHN